MPLKDGLSVAHAALAQRQPPRRLRRHPSLVRRGDTPLLSEEGCRLRRRGGVQVCNPILQGDVEGRHAHCSFSLAS